MISPIEIHEHLPKENCGECGTATCMGFAVRLLNRKANLNDCPYLKQAKYIQAGIILKEMLAPILEAKATKLVIRENLCNGCGNCVIVCPPNVSRSIEATGGKGPSTNDVVLKMRNGVVVEMNLSFCKRFEEASEEVKAEPCRLCIDACPFKAIEFL